MKSKHNLMLIVLASTFMVLAVVAGVLLRIESGRLRSAKERLETRMLNLRNGYARDPFPNDENIAATRKNVETTESELAALKKRMSRGQLSVRAGMQPLEWLTLLTQMRRDLTESARTNQVVLPPNFFFGFPKYADGRPPKRADDVARLTLQLRSIESVCGLLFSSGISQVERIRRDEFEDKSAPSSTSGRVSDLAGGATNAAEAASALYTKEHFVFEFRAKESSLFAAISGLAALDPFMVATSIRIAGGVGVRLGAGVGEEEVAGNTSVPNGGLDERDREERIVSGSKVEDPALVAIELDVYSFGESKRETPK